MDLIFQKLSSFLTENLPQCDEKRDCAFLQTRIRLHSAMVYATENLLVFRIYGFWMLQQMAHMHVLTVARDDTFAR